MASLQRHVVNGKTYWRIVESRRVNGKPRPVPLLYLGTADQLLEKLLHAEAGRVRIQSFQHGDVAALKAVADRLDVVGIIDRHIPKAAHASPSVGMTLLLSAINRAVRPCSKRGWSTWAESTSLSHLLPGIEPAKLTSQFFWDQMNSVDLEALRAIERDLTQVMIQELDIQLDLLFYDTTNFFTYIASDNNASTLARRGKNKQKRTDLRQFGLALVISRDGQLPLCSQVYEGNTVDAKLFPNAFTHIRQRLADLSVDSKSITLVYDKGNMSKANQGQVDASDFGFVASLVPAQHADLMAIPVADYQPLTGCPRLEGLPTMRMMRTIWGAERTVILFCSEKLREGQIRGLQQHLDKCLSKLSEWKEQLGAPRSGARTQEHAEEKIRGILTGQHLAEVVKVTYHPDRHGSDRLEYAVDQVAIEHLHKEVFGKRILITNRHDWSTADIILAYRGQSHVESVFRQWKDDEHLAVRPQHHWTDQKVQVHAFICLLALLLARVVERQARQLGYRESLSGLLDLLGRVRLAMVLQASGPKGGRPRVTWQLEEAKKESLKLFRACVPGTAPFVYTDQLP